MAFVKVVLCIISLVLGLALMQAVDFIVDCIKRKKGDKND